MSEQPDEAQLELIETIAETRGIRGVEMVNIMQISAADSIDMAIATLGFWSAFLHTQDEHDGESLLTTAASILAQLGP